MAVAPGPKAPPKPPPGASVETGVWVKPGLAMLLKTGAGAREVPKLFKRVFAPKPMDDGAGAGVKAKAGRTRGAAQVMSASPSRSRALGDPMTRVVLFGMLLATGAALLVLRPVPSTRSQYVERPPPVPSEHGALWSGQDAARRGDLASADDRLATHREGSADDAFARLAHADVLVRRNALDEARQLLETHLRGDPQDARGLRAYGEVLRRLGDFPGARGAFEAYLKVRPQAEDASALRAWIDAR